MTTPSAASIIQNSGLLRSHTLADYVNNISHEQPNISATTTTSTTWELPLIDLHSPLAHKSLAAACRDWGFFQLQNHGLPRQLLDGLRTHAHSLFQLPLAQKEKAACCNATNFYGYGVVKARTYFPNAWMEAFDMEWTPDRRVRQHVERIGLRGDEFKSFWWECGNLHPLRSYNVKSVAFRSSYHLASFNGGHELKSFWWECGHFEFLTSSSILQCQSVAFRSSCHLAAFNGGQ